MKQSGSQSFANYQETKKCKMSKKHARVSSFQKLRFKPSLFESVKSLVLSCEFFHLYFVSARRKGTMRALCHVQNEATSVNSRVLRRGQFSRGLSIVPLAGYNCLSNLRPWGEFALSISRGSPALHTVPETIDRCITTSIL